MMKKKDSGRRKEGKRQQEEEKFVLILLAMRTGDRGQGTEDRGQSKEDGTKKAEGGVHTKHLHSQTVRARELKFFREVHLAPPVTCHMSHVTCQM